MTKIFSEVVNAVSNIQTMTGRDCPKLTKASFVFSDVPGFTSLNGLEATAMIAHKLSLNVKIGENLFVKEQKGERIGRNLSEVVKRIEELKKK